MRWPIKTCEMLKAYIYVFFAHYSLWWAELSTPKWLKHVFFMLISQHSDNIAKLRAKAILNCKTNKKSAARQNIIHLIVFLKVFAVFKN